MKRALCISVLVLSFLAVNHSAFGALDPIIVFSETFNDYPDHVTTDYGVPLQSEGADEKWYGGRFEAFDHGTTLYEDLSVRYGDYARFVNEAGILFNISTVGLTDVTLSYDWKTHNEEHGDHLVVGYFVGDLNYGPGDLYRDFYNEDFGGDHNAAVEWWDTQWTEIMRTRGTNWHSVTGIALPGGESSVWVAFWMDNGAGDKGKIDNIVVTAIPEPTTLVLLGMGALLIRRKTP